MKEEGIALLHRSREWCFLEAGHRKGENEMIYRVAYSAWIEATIWLRHLLIRCMLPPDRLIFPLYA